jgi:penicillin-binding protein 2
MLDSKKNQSIVDSRLKFIIFIIFCMFCIIAYNISSLQLKNHAIYKNKSVRNATNIQQINPVRGDIFDRNGDIVATTKPAFSLVVVPEKIEGFNQDKTKSIASFLSQLKNIIYLNANELSDLESRFLNVNNYNKFKELIIKKSLKHDELYNITANMKFISGMYISSRKIRDYNYGADFLSVVGYVSKMSEKEIKVKDLSKYKKGDYIGKAGIERVLDEDLYGNTGEEYVFLNAHGKILNRKINIAPSNGKDINLTIDSSLQRKAYELLGEETGAIVAIDPYTGEILALASTPTFDPNKIINGISNKDYDQYFRKSSPLFNRTIQGQYSMASTIKPFLALSALENNIIKPEKKLFSGDSYKPKKTNIHFREWKRGGHGWVDLETSIEVSSDIYYYQLGEMMGIDMISSELFKYGFGKSSNIILKGEKSGIVPTRAWKKENYNDSWYIGETINTAIGQGFVTATPLQLAMATGMLVNGGKLYKPKLIKNNRPPIISNQIDFNKDNLEIVKNGMRRVMVGKRGTAKVASYKSKFKLAGKTGTAQVFSTNGKKMKDNEDLPKHLRDHAMFIGYAPFDDPDIVVVVIIENVGGGGSFAAPVGVSLLDKFLLDKINREEGIL